MPGYIKAVATSVIASWVVASVALAGTATPAAAGQIKEKYYGPSHGTPLGDPPDAEIDQFPEPRKSFKQAKEYRSTEYDNRDNYEYRGSVKDGYDEIEPARRYRRERSSRRYNKRNCVHPRDIRDGLRSDGWADFSRFDADDGVICMRARRRDSGRLYEIELDRCSGLIVSAKPIRKRHYRRSRWYRDRW